MLRSAPWTNICLSQFWQLGKFIQSKGRHVSTYPLLLKIQNSSTTPVLTSIGTISMFLSQLRVLSINGPFEEPCAMRRSSANSSLVLHEKKGLKHLLELFVSFVVQGISITVINRFLTSPTIAPTATCKTGKSDP